MKKVLCLIIVALFTYAAQAQLTDGSTVPDFTFTDINGVTQNLYTYLNQGKYVAIDNSTTWCHPCWDYDTSGTMDSLYTRHDIPGDNTWKVLFIEVDINTTLADLQGTGTNTVGNWVAFTHFPIMNPVGIPLNDYKTAYNINSYPTLYIICPNKKAYADSLNKGYKPFLTTWEYIANTMCGPAGLDNIKDSNPITIYPNPANDHVTLYFSLNFATEVKLSVTNILGQSVAVKNFGSLSPGDQSLKYDVSNFNPGIYFFTVSDGNSRYVRKKVVVQ